MKTVLGITGLLCTIVGCDNTIAEQLVAQMLPLLMPQITDIISTLLQELV